MLLLLPQLGVILDGVLLELANHEHTPLDRRHAIINTLKEVFDSSQSVVNLYYNYDNLMNWSVFERLLTTLTKLLEDTQSDVAWLERVSADGSGMADAVETGRNRGVTVEFDAAIQSVDQESKDKEGHSEVKRTTAGGAAHVRAPSNVEQFKNTVVAKTRRSGSIAPLPNSGGLGIASARRANLPPLATAASARVLTHSETARSLSSNSGSADDLAGDSNVRSAPNSPQRLSQPTGSSPGQRPAPTLLDLQRMPTQLTIDTSTTPLSPAAALHVSCVELLVTIVAACDVWFSAKFKESPAGQQGQQGQQGRLEGSEDEQELDARLRDLDLRGPPSRKNTVMHRFVKQKADKKAIETAMRLARTKSLEKAIAYLEGVGMLKHDAAEVTDFIHREINKLELEAVGEYLGGKRPKHEAPFEEQVRLQYISGIHFGGLTLQDALRRFLTESGFRLPSESQKIERLLESFADVYSTDNPSYFDDADAAFIMANAILMLNTSLHNPNVRDKDRLTMHQFANICKAIEGTHFAPQDLENIYKEIHANGYQIELTASFKKHGRGGRVSLGGADEKTAQLDLRDQYVRKLQAYIRKAEFMMKRGDMFAPIFSDASSYETVTSLFEVSWYQFMAILSFAIERATDTKVVSACLDGFKHALRLCTRMNLAQEKNALASSLARFTFLYRNRLAFKPRSALEINTDMVKGCHLRELWLDSINCTSEDDEGVEEVSKVIDNIKKEYIRETNFTVLREIQDKIVGDVVRLVLLVVSCVVCLLVVSSPYLPFCPFQNVVLPGRYFIREGNIGKMCGNGNDYPVSLLHLRSTFALPLSVCLASLILPLCLLLRLFIVSSHVLLVWRGKYRRETYIPPVPVQRRSSVCQHPRKLI